MNPTERYAFQSFPDESSMFPKIIEKNEWAAKPLFNAHTWYILATFWRLGMVDLKFYSVESTRSTFSYTVRWTNSPVLQLFSSKTGWSKQIFCAAGVPMDKTKFLLGKGALIKIHGWTAAGFSHMRGAHSCSQSTFTAIVSLEPYNRIWRGYIIIYILSTI